MPKWPVTRAAELCGDAKLGRNGFCLPAAKIERWLKEGRYVVTDAAITDSGLTAPYKLRLQIEGGPVISVKFKRAPDELDAFNNSPRLEIAAYEIQKLFLDDSDYVVPPTVLVCLPVAKYKDILPDLTPHPGESCALGVMAYWLEGMSDKNVIDSKEWATDQKYRDNLGKLNVLTVLIGHQDSIGDNFLRSTDRAHPRVFSIDNGLAFGAMGANPIQWFSSKWSSFRVPVIPEDVVERLRHIDHAALERLQSIAQLEQRGDVFVSTEPSKAIDPAVGARRKGGTIQLGLTTAEITDLEVRVAKVLGDLDQHKLLEGPKEPRGASSRR